MQNLLVFHNDFIREKRLAKKSEATITSYKESFKLFYNFLKYKKLEEINKSKVVEFLEYLNTRKRIIGRGYEVTGVSANTIITYKNRLSPFFVWLKQNRYIKINPFDNIELPRIEKDRREKILHKEQVQRIFNAISYNIKWRDNFLKKRNETIFSVLFYTGLRKGELLGLKVSDIDLNNKIININASTSKSRRTRRISMNDNLYLILEDYLNSRKKYNNPYLFISSKDKVLTKNGLKHLVNKIENVIKFKFYLHQFRHTFAVNTLNNIGDVYTVQSLLGHQKITTTAIYLSYIPEEKKRIAVNSLNLDDLV